MTATTPPPPEAANDVPPPAYDPPSGSDILDITLVAQPSTQELLVSLVPPTEPKPAGEKMMGKRAPLDLCLVIDVSGSMDSEAPVPGEQDKNETTGLSVLDVVKHATRTIIESMDDDDRVAIVTFSDSSEVVAPLTVMTKNNRASVWNKVDGLRTKGMTNLWDGLKAGMNLVTATDSKPSSSSDKDNDKGKKPVLATVSSSSKRSSILGSIGFGKKKQASSSTSDEPKPEFQSDVKIAPPADPAPSTSDGRLPAVFILTDGQPNVEPPRGHIPMLKSYLDALPPDAPKLTISTFGFGYNLDSRLLDEIADLGKGMYGFIPDSGMVGTVFVHAVANLMATWATNCILDVEIVGQDPKDKVKLGVLGALPVTLSSWGASIQVGDIQYGQSRDVVLKLPAECFGPDSKRQVNITARYSPHTLASGEPVAQAQRTLTSAHTNENSVVLHHETYRLSFVSAVAQLFAQKNKRNTTPQLSGPQFESSLANHINNPLLKEYEPSTALTSDITSQVVLGLESEHWGRWGIHYLPSLARSHQRQQCSNFKDAGLQVYGRNSNAFTTTRDRIDSIFDSLPPPTPSLKDRQVYRGGRGVPASYAPVTSMAMYRSSAAPCFAGWCRVDAGQGQTLKVCDLRRGTVVRTPSGTAQVAAILKTACPGRMTNLCTIGELAVTPWHPIIHSGEWTFPAEVCEPRSASCEAVYSILLEPSSSGKAHALCIEDTWCVTLGHGCTDSVRAHGFLGDYTKVVEALSKMDGYYADDGVIESAGVARDSVTGMVCGFKSVLKGQVGCAQEVALPVSCKA
ncbi:hypothetical protein FRC08_006094 [Ceratobasidium sp. 394]|nr:hypothetical protein FRC08_006094 [Ceratobasidium sp. 394]